MLVVINIFHYICIVLDIRQWNWISHCSFTALQLRNMWDPQREVDSLIREYYVHFNFC
jgi:hypothetical protein